jgi:hypothetical protein
LFSLSAPFVLLAGQFADSLLKPRLFLCLFLRSNFRRLNLRLLGGRFRAYRFDLLHLFRRGFLHGRSDRFCRFVHGFPRKCLVIPDEYGRKKAASMGGSLRIRFG